MRSIFTIWLCAVGLIASRIMPVRGDELVRFAATDPDVGRAVFLRGELVKPTGAGPFPAVILMHGCGGWQPAVYYALEAHADYLARHGYVVLDLDSFGPRHFSGNALCASDMRLREALSYRAYDAFDAMRYLDTQPFVDPRNIFLMGQSNGGSVALEVARRSGPKSYDGPTAFRAVVAYYPWCGVYTQTTVRLASPLLIFGGGEDDWVSARECASITASDAEFRVFIYPEAHHSFDVNILPERYMGHLIGYDEAAALDSDAKMLAFFDAHLTGSGQRERLIAVQGLAGAH